jgi:ubiquinone biosynthesis protein
MNDASAINAKFLSLLPEGVAAYVTAALSSGLFDPARLQAAFASVDWALHRDKLQEVLRELLPIEELVPPVYEQWRPVIRDGFDFIGARLSSDRLAPKLVEQLTLPASTSVEDRILTFIRRVPVLQKIGQTVARNANLENSFRARLTILEDGIHDVEESEIRAEVETQLAPLLAEYRVDLKPGIYGEGSVSALLRFTCRACPGIGPVAGVFKVLKPFIPKYFKEELALLADLAAHFDANQQHYNLDKLNLRAILDEIRELYEREIDFIHERENLITAGERYGGVAGLRIPRPIAALSTASITAMTEERSVKIIDAFPGNLLRRKELARRLIECLVARPLFLGRELSPFHADPHVGNLRVDEANGDLVLLDWALTGTLTTVDRRSLLLLLLTLPLRDEAQILAALSEISLAKDEVTQIFLKRQIEIFMDDLPLGSIPNPGSLGDLVDDLLRAGLRFSGSFLIFRKMLSTLADVVEQISPSETIQQVVLEYAVTNGLVSALAPGARKREFQIPLRASDLLQLGLSAQLLLPRVWAQTARSIARQGAFLPGHFQPKLELK